MRFKSLSSGAPTRAPAVQLTRDLVVPVGAERALSHGGQSDEDLRSRSQVSGEQAQKSRVPILVHEQSVVLSEFINVLLFER